MALTDDPVLEEEDGYWDEFEDDEDLTDDVVLDENSSDFVAQVIEKCIIFLEELCDTQLFPYQHESAYRIFESLIINDGEEITIIQSRQSGKSEVLANCVATAMVLFPKLALMFPDLMGKFKKGLMVGTFAPVETQAETLYGRIVDRLTSDHAMDILQDPEIDDAPVGGGKQIRLRRNGSLCRMQTANPRAKIESKSYHFIVIDEAQHCFPAETLVLTSEGQVPIGEIAERPDKDWFVASQDSDGEVTWARAQTTFVTPRLGAPLVRVDHDYGSVYCTANHPFAVGDARVAAIDLVPGTPLSLVQGAGEPRRSPSKASDHALLPASVLAGTHASHPGDHGASGAPRAGDGRGEPWSAKSEGGRAHAGEQPHDPARCAGEGLGSAEGDRARTRRAGRERSGTVGATAAAPRRVGAGMDVRACLPYWRASGEGRPADALQDRSGPRWRPDRCRDRRAVTPGPGSAGTGRAEGCVAQESRVVRVQVLEPGSPEIAQFRGEVDYVYTLSVDSPTHTYVADGVLVGNCDDYVVRKSIHPMGAFYNATIVKTGTPDVTKGDFYSAIQHNKRRQTRGRRQNHFEFDWKHCARYNPNYAKFIAKEKRRIGEDSDEFMLSYACKWLLERGMFTSESQMEALGDKSMQMVKAWHASPVVVGIDPARKQDSTVVTVIWVDWDRPDEFGFYDHRILNWLEMHGDDWEEQYFRIVEFLANYDVYKVAVDSQGVGDAVAQRLDILLPGVEVVPMGSNTGDQSLRWKHLMQLMQRGRVGWPAHAKARRVRAWKRFNQQMIDLEKKYQGKYMLAEAPDEAEAHDDYPDSLALGCFLTLEHELPEVETTENPFLARSR